MSGKTDADVGRVPYDEGQVAIVGFGQERTPSARRGERSQADTASAEARGPVRMAAAFRKAVEAGREGFLAGRMPVRAHASASSPVAGVVRLPDAEVPA